MSLVADYGSDVSSSEDETIVQHVTETENTTTTKKPSLSSLLPPPKSKRNGPVKIMVDLPSPGKIDDKEDQVSKKLNTSGSGLFALLPAPKRPITSNEQNSLKKSNANSKPTTASTSFVPHTLTKRKSIAVQKSSNLSSSSKIKEKEVKARDETIDITEKNNFAESFFPLGAEITNIIPSKAIEDETLNIVDSDKTESSNAESSNVAESYNMTNDYNYNYNYNYNYQWETDANSYTEYPGYYYDESQLQQSSEQALPDNQIDDEVIQKLGGRRGKEGPIIIKEINAADQMADAWQAQMGELTKPGRLGSGGTAHLKPTKGQKRKHNLMYLAYQAAAMENDLREQFAANKKTKRETQAKYGF